MFVFHSVVCETLPRRIVSTMGNFIVNYSLDSLADGVLDNVLHKTVVDIQEYVARHAAISATHGRPVLYRMQFKELFEFKSSDALFLTFDSDKDGKVDFFEVMCVLILGSRVSPLAKMRLIFQLFDLTSAQELGRCELVLLLLCTMSGLGKLCRAKIPSEEAVESLVNVSFAKTWRIGDEARVNFNLFSAWLRSRQDVKALFRRFASNATNQLRQIRLEKKVRRYKLNHPDAYKQAETRKNPVSNKAGARWLNRTKGPPASPKQTKLYKRADAIILWQVYHSFRKDQRGRVNAVAFKEELEGHELFPYAKTIFGDIHNYADIYDHAVSYIDMLSKMHPHSPHEELMSMAHDAAHHHASTDPAYERALIDNEQKDEIEAILEMFYNEGHSDITVIEAAAALSATGSFKESDILHLFNELGVSYDEYLTVTELKNILAKSYRVSTIADNVEEANSESD